MRVQVELLGLFRQKAGTDRLEVQLDAAPAARAGAAPAAASSAEAGRVPFGTAPCKAQGRPGPSGNTPSVLQCLLGAEGFLGSGSLVEAGRLREGVLVFLRHPGGAVHRVFRPAEEQVAEGQSVVLSTAMGGG